MEDHNEEGNIQKSTRRNWANLPSDILTRIFALVCMTDVVFNVPGVCRSWRTASTDPVLWKTLDLELFTQKFRYRPSFFVWVVGFQCPGTRFKLFFENLVKGNHENLTKLVMSRGTLFNNGHLIYIAERTPNLECFVLPNCPLITEQGLRSALRLWRKLETISISFTNYTPHLILQAIGQTCKKISAIKIVHGVFNENAALAMINFLPGLKIITLRCDETDKDAVEILLDSLTNLEELYISDKVDFLERAIARMHLPIENEDIAQKASRLKKFHVCQNGYCTRCPTAPDNFKVIKG